jgi:hypothetical protein
MCVESCISNCVIQPIFNMWHKLCSFLVILVAVNWEKKKFEISLIHLPLGLLCMCLVAENLYLTL